MKGWYESGRFGPDAVEAISAAVLTESLLGGVTTVANQHYFFPAGSSLPYVEATLAAAAASGSACTRAGARSRWDPIPT